MHAPPYADYVDPDGVLGELARSRRLFREHGWRVVDISGKAVEETAGRILELIGRKASEPRGGSSATG